jgi:acetyl-CoA carboxylase biotin carboxyl carrier protein
VEKAGGGTAGGAVLEVELDLRDPGTGSHRVDRHCSFDPEAAGERQELRDQVGPQGALTRDRGLELETGEAADGPAGEADRNPEAAPFAARERTDREIAAAGLHSLDERAQLARRGTEVTVAKDDRLGARLLARECEPERRRDGLTLAPLSNRRQLGTGLDSERGCRVGRPVVRDDEACTGQGGLDRPDRRGDPLLLVARGDDHDSPGSARQFGGHRGYSAANGAVTSLEGSQLTEIEAHITGTVWKIEVSPGDTVDEGDTVVILESMKMEMPVEAEDAGVVKEIRVEEGESVSEGDTLVVLE